MSRPARTLSWTSDEFLAWEREQPGRHEWDGTSIVAMTGATVGHGLCVGNLRDAVRDQLPSGCKVFTETLKLRCGERWRYPDLLVVCTPLDRHDDIAETATFVAEVLSPSTARTDRFIKVEDYAKVPALEGYLIVDPAERNVTLYRCENRQLVPAPPDEIAGGSLMLFGNVSVHLDDVYAGVLDVE